MDPGQDESDKLIGKVEKEIKKHYSKAKKEVKQKFEDYNRRFGVKDEIKKKQLKAGEITQQEYNDWRKGQIMMGERWKNQLEDLSTDLLNSHNIARSIVNGYLPQAYAIGHNYGTFQIEKGINMSTSYTLYDKSTVERIIKDNPQLLPSLNPKSETARKIREGKIKKWSQKQIQSNCLQGILQGESIPQIAERISNITLQEAKSTIRYARTMITGAENAGRTDSYKRAESMGIELEQQWLATLDDRTRDEHREMDGEHVPVGEEFSNGCRYPGDPLGDPEEIWCCRCTLVPLLTGIPELNQNDDLSDTDLRSTSHMEQESYNEWKKSHMKSQPILSQKQKGESIKNAFIGKYKSAAKRLKDVEP